jgi:probable DNA repair protein
LLSIHIEIDEFLKGGGTLIVPSAQRAAALRLAYGAARLAEGARVWPTPQVLPWSAWLEHGLDEARARGAPVPRRLSRAEGWWLWREAVRAACTDALEVLWPDGLVDAVRRATLLLEDFGLELHQPATPEAVVLLRAQAHFARSCEQRHALWGSSWRSCASFIRLASPTRLAGFDELGPARCRWLSDLGVAPNGVEPLGDAPCEAQLCRAEDPDQEARLAADWCARQLARDPNARLLLVVPRLVEQRHRWLRALLQRLDPNSEASTGNPAVVAVEGGEPLTSYALVQTALRLLSLSLGEVDFTALSGVLRTPYLPAECRARRLQLDAWLRAHNIEVVPQRLPALLDSVARALDADTAAMLASLLPGIDSAATASDWARSFARTLERSGWPGTSSSEEQQQRQRFDELLGEFAALPSEDGRLTAPAALAALRQLAESTAFEPATDDAPVTLTASVSDPIVRYDGIWVAGLTAEHWPPPLRADPLIPWHMQRAAGMSTAQPDAPLRFAERWQQLWRAATGRLVLSYACTEGDSATDASQLLHGVVAEPEVAPDLSSWLATQAPRLDAVDDCAGPAWSGEALRGGARLLELQALCPFRAFAELRLQAAPLVEPSPGIDPRVRGQILHRALELFWLRIRDAATLAARRDQLPALARTCIDEALIEATQRVPGGLDSHLLHHEAARDACLFGSLIEWELERAPFMVEAVERKQELALEAGRLRLRIDRVDRLGDGRAIVFDYKTGTPQTFNALADRLQRPQLPVYAVAIGDSTAAVAELYLTRAGLKLRGVADRDGRLADLKPLKADQPEWPQLQQRWRHSLDALLAEYARGWAAVTPLPGACDYCHLRTLCRVRPATVTEPQDPGPEPETP